MRHEITHEEVENWLENELDWPQYFVSGEHYIDKDHLAPVYYKVDGPNGPVSYKNPEGGPVATTMYDLAMDAQGESFRACLKEETPWADE